MYYDTELVKVRAPFSTISSLKLKKDIHAIY